MARPRSAASACVHGGSSRPGASLSTLGKTLAQGIREYAEQNQVEIEGLPKDPKEDCPRAVLTVLRNFLATIFPLLAPAPTRHREPDPGARQR